MALLSNPLAKGNVVFSCWLLNSATVSLRGHKPSFHSSLLHLVLKLNISVVGGERTVKLTLPVGDKEMSSISVPSQHWPRLVLVE